MGVQTLLRAPGEPLDDEATVVVVGILGLATHRGFHRCFVHGIDLRHPHFSIVVLRWQVPASSPGADSPFPGVSLRLAPVPGLRVESHAFDQEEAECWW